MGRRARSQDMLAFAPRLFRHSPRLTAHLGQRRTILMDITAPPPGFHQVVFIETGTGTDQHGTDVTKASVRAIKDAISWNSIPSLDHLVPGGNAAVKLRLQLAVPFDANGQPPCLNMAAIDECFAYGTLQKPIELLPGGARFSSMCSVPSLGDEKGRADWI